jgi:hypothetical protein
MTRRLRRIPRPLKLAISLALLAALLAVPSALGRAPKPRAHAAAAYLTGIGDEHTEMFSDRQWQKLHTPIVRDIVPYDASVRGYSLKLATAWIRAAERRHQQVLVAFYHSDYTPTQMPSVASYQADTKKFIKLFPYVREYQPWNEANRGNIRYRYEKLNSPTAAAAAAYYQALRQVCTGCTVVGLDILDQSNVASSLRYISQFTAQIHHLKAPMPTVWGLHNYSDTNRFSSSRTRAILRAVPGQVWLTETGGIVKFGGAFSNRRGSGLSRAAKAISYMFKLASSNPRIKRLYIYEWSGASQSAVFDAGLTDYRHNPRAGYVVVCIHMHANNCKVKISTR